MKTFTDYCKDLVEENIDEHEGRRNRIYDNRGENLKDFLPDE